ncbi:MAG TPA: flagellar motor protein MotB [Gammaproteobacteria bacterium]|jgi:chemotaxis protein MotB|nr:flagellar motor protein MotB [Gammaproteobacteria bacterium]
MSAPNTPEEKKDVKPIIIINRKIKKVVHGNHAGSWKIAYADFVTAMMTFFMLMWLLSMLNKAQLEGISEYFKNPNRKSSQQAVESKVKTENALSQKESIGMSTNTEENQQKKTKDETQKEKEKKKNDNTSKLNALALQKDLQTQLNTNPKLSQYKNSLNIKMTPDGLKIELKDLDGKPMFSNGKADFANYAKGLLDWLAPTLNKYPNQVIVVGHTDSAPLNRADYSNWELSSDRAAATRRVLIDAGMDNRKIVRIIGAADTTSLKNAKGNDPTNRRIAIIVLTDEALKNLQEQ